MKEPIPYKAEFPAGTQVRIADQAFLQDFMATWKYHHELRPEQLVYADHTVRVTDVGFYHGGDPLYNLEGVPGLWHERCLRAA